MTAYHNTLSENGLDTFSTNSFTLLVVIAIPVDSSGSFLFHVIARRVSDGVTKVFIVRAGFKRVGSNDVTVFGLSILDALGTVADLATMTTVAVDVQANGANVEVMVRGLSGQAIDWSCITDGKYLQNI